MNTALNFTPTKRDHELPIVIVADGSETTRMKIKVLLEAEQMHVHLADTSNRLLSLVEEDPPDLIILDVHLPGANITRILHRLKDEEKTRSIMVMLLSPAASTQRHIQSLSEGADDVMPKPLFNGLLLAKTKAMLRLKALQNELAETNEKLAKLSVTDPLTGLYNYRYLYERIGQELADSARHKTPLSCISLDIDHFKSVNDTLGHQFGDLVLAAFAKLLRQPTRLSDIVARNGGEEFMIVLPRTPLAEALVVGNRVLELVREYLFKDNESCIHLTTSAGVTGVDEACSIGVDELIRRVDIAMYKAKRTGRDRICTWDAGDKLYPEPDPKTDEEERTQPRRVETVAEQAEQTSVESVCALVAAMEAKDRLAMARSKKSSELAHEIALALGLDALKASAIAQAALLHDIGKLGISDAILNKEGALSQAESRIAQKHPIYSVEILKNVEAVREELPMIRHHHERYDGTGYPDRLTGDTIPIGARVLAVADAYVAMTTASRYKKALPQGMVIEALKHEAGREFDPRIVKTMLFLLTSDTSEEKP